MSADIASKVDLAFWYLRSKYCSWWVRRVATPELLAAERVEWGRVLESYSRRQIKDAAFVMRRDFKFRPPRAAEFARLMDRRASRPMDAVTGRRFDAPVHSGESKRFFLGIKSILG
ncbi:MAG: hypothetical protein ACXV8Q_09270 [Methylobacter sp.]